MARQRKTKQQRKSIYVLGDGKTEQYYFNHLKSIKGYNYKIRPRLFNDISIENAEYYIDQLLSGDADYIFYFTDYDTIVNQQKHQKFQAFKNKYKNISNVIILESMPSIEYWFLLHFKKTSKQFRSSQGVVKELKKELRGYSKRKRYLENPNWVQNLCANRKMDKAIGRAKEVLKEKKSSGGKKYFPFSMVHKAIEKFDRLKQHK